MRVRVGQRPPRGSVLCLLSSLCPHGLHAQRLPWASLACWRGPGSGHMAWGTQVSSPGRAQLTAPGKRDRVHGTISEEASTSARGGKPRLRPWARTWTMRRVPLGKMTRGPSSRQRREGPSTGSPREGGRSRPRATGSWHKAAPCTGHVGKAPPGGGRKREMPFLEQQGRETLEKAVFGKRKDHRTANR